MEAQKIKTVVSATGLQVVVERVEDELIVLQFLSTFIFTEDYILCLQGKRGTRGNSRKHLHHETQNEEISVMVLGELGFDGKYAYELFLPSSNNCASI
jgi:hypothetical protein